MDKIKILLQFLSNLEREFKEMGELTVNYVFKAYTDFDITEGFGLMCSTINVYEGEEVILFNPNNQTLYYEGETMDGNVSGKTTFPIVGDLLKVIPIGLSDALKRVGNTGVIETFSLEKDNRMLDF